MHPKLRHIVPAMFAFVLMLGGCNDSHGRGDDAGVMDSGGGDSGSALCGGETCGAGQRCCSACPGSPDFCVTGDMCPLFDCPPPPPGCEACGSGELCCPVGCAGEGSFCFAGMACPPPPPCPPPIDCDDTRSCPDGFYCDRGDACRGAGMCFPAPDGCPEDCPGVCGCDGIDYCNSCIAAQAGVTVSHAGACEPVTCEGRSYCECTAAPGCEPLVDLTPGCVCPCDDPFNCSGDACNCVCGGAEYRDCAPVGRCPVTELRCEVGCSAQLGADGCLSCFCVVPG